jgi:hypothetical protein
VDTTANLMSAADGLQAVATRLIGIKRNDTGRPSEEPTYELARAVAAWMVAVRRLAASGEAAWIEAQRGFTREPDDPELPPEPDPFAMIRAQLDLTTAIVAGDLAMDDLAYCKLLRRDDLPTWRIGGDVPAWWPALMRLLDRSPGDPMTRSARYLDVTLAPARDQLLVHRDPALWTIPSLASWGSVTRQRRTVRGERNAAAMDELRRVNASLSFKWDESTFEGLLSVLVAIAEHLGPDQRKGIRTAYAFAGLESPSMSDIVNHALELLRLHAEQLDLLSAEREDYEPTP